MRTRLFVTMLLMLFVSSAFAENDGRDEWDDWDAIMWANAYKGNFSLSHKMSVTGPDETLKDALMNQFVMAYVHYRMGNDEDTEAVFKGVDLYLEHNLKLNIR